MEIIGIKLVFFVLNKIFGNCFVTCQVDRMKNLAELSQHGELIAHMKDIAGHVLSADNMRLKLV